MGMVLLAEREKNMNKFERGCDAHSFRHVHFEVPMEYLRWICLVAIENIEC